MARKWKCKIGLHSCHGYVYHCSHARHGHHGHQDRQDNQDNQDTRDKQDRQERQIWHLNLTFQVTCQGQLSQFLQCFIHGLEWINRSTCEERERLSNWSFVGIIKVKGDLDNNEVIKALQKITSKEEPKISYWWSELPTKAGSFRIHMTHVMWLL